MYLESKLEAEMDKVEGRTDGARKKNATKSLKDKWENLTEGTQQKYVKKALKQLSQESEYNDQPAKKETLLKKREKPAA